jgi:hypothetical protein
MASEDIFERAISDDDPENDFPPYWGEYEDEEEDDGGLGDAVH